MGGERIALEAVADGLWLRLRDVILAERRLEGFTFAPEAPETGAAARLSGLAGDARGLAELSRDMVLRALAAASDDVSGRILAEVARSGPVGLDALAGRVGLPALAVGERVGALAQLGLVTRDLERDSAGATAAGRGLVDLVEVLATALGERVRAGLPALLVP